MPFFVIETTDLPGNQMIRQMVGAVEVAEDDMVVVDVDAAEGTVVEQEPGIHPA